MVYKIINNQLVSPPQTGTLKDGRTVTGYNKLPLSVLKDEGWKPLVRHFPVEEELENNHYERVLEENETEIIERWESVNEV